MPTSLPMPTKAVGDVFTTTLWNSYLRDNVNKLLNSGHRVLTVAQFGALASPEGTKGTVAPDEVYLEVDATNGILWHLGYESGETTYKWRFLGGSPLYSEVTTSESTASGTYAALSTAGPSISLPVAGDYMVTPHVQINPASVAAALASMSYDIGGTGAVDADRIVAGNPAANAMFADVSWPKRKQGLTAVTLTSKYKATNNSTFANRSLSVTPIRLAQS